MTTELAHAEELHRDAMVINCLAAARTVAELTEPMTAGGVTAVNWTIAAPGLDFAVNDLVSVVKDISAIRYEIATGIYNAKVIESVADLDACKRDGTPGLILGFQDTLALEDRLDLAGLYHAIGVRIIQLTYQRRNLIGDGCGEADDAGLSTFGRELIAELNRLGILIDLSHVGPRTTEEAIEASSAPCSFTHANSHAVYAHIRNKSDDAIRRLADRGGVIGVDAISRFLNADGHTEGTSIDDLVDHLDHIVELVGIDHVGLGLDISEGMTREDVKRRGDWVTAHLPEVSGSGSLNYDTYYPSDLRSMSQTQSITEALLRRGYGDDDVRKILGGNFYRLFDAVWGAGS